MKANKTTFIAIFAVLLLTIAAVVILKPQPPGPDNGNGIGSILPLPSEGVRLYFTKNKGSEIVTEAVTRPWPSPKPASSSEMVSYAMSELLKGPTDQETKAGYFSEIPKGTRVLSVTNNSDALQVNLSEEFASGGGSNSMLMRMQQVSKTMASVPQKQPVYLQVNGQQLETLGGEGVMVTQPVTKDPSVTQ